MFNYKRYREIAIAMMVLIGISGCGSSSTTVTTDTENIEQNSSLVTGDSLQVATEENVTRVEEPVEEIYHLKFIDSPVVNLTYECGDKLARTDDEGNLSCTSFPIIFSAIGIEIGTLEAVTDDHRVFPEDLVGVDRLATSGVEVQKIASFLQSLDDDGDVSQFIVIQDDSNLTQSKPQRTIMQKRDLPRLMDMDSGTMFALLRDRGFTPVSLYQAEQNLRRYGLGIVPVPAATYTSPPVIVSPTPILDITLPVVTLNGDANISLYLNEVYSELNATAMDDRDGNVTNTITISGLVDTSTLGVYTLTYTATDGAGNQGSAIRTVNIIQTPDTTPPVVTLNGDSNITLYLNETYTELNATAVDNRDGNVTNTITISGLVDTSTLGVYTLTYTATDSAGNKGSATRIVNIIEKPNNPPIAYEQNITVGKNSINNPITLSGSDIDGDTLSYSIATQPTHGTVSFTGVGSQVVYTPTVDYNGSDSFSFVVNDGKVDSAPAEINITVSSLKEMVSFDVKGHQNSIGTYDTSGYARGVTLSADGTKAFVADGSAGLQIIDLTISTQYRPVDFEDTNITLKIDNTIPKDMTLTISTDRDDIITIGDYDTTLSYDEYHNQEITIPISSISGATGQTIITLTLSNGIETFTRKVYFNVYP